MFDNVVCPVCGESLLFDWNEQWTLAAHYYQSHSPPNYYRECFCGERMVCVADYHDHFSEHGGLTAHYLSHALGVKGDC